MHVFVAKDASAANVHGSDVLSRLSLNAPTADGRPQARPLLVLLGVALHGHPVITVAREFLDGSGKAALTTQPGAATAES